MMTSVVKTLDRIIGPAMVRMLPRPKSGRTEHLHRILIIRPGGIGDAVLLMPVLAALKEAAPASNVDILAETRNAGVFEISRDVERILRYDKSRELLSVFKRTYDAVIDTEQWHRLSAVVARMTRAPMLIGFGTNERSRLFTHAIPYSHDDHEHVSFMRLLGPLSVNANEDLKVPFIHVPEQDLVNASRLLTGFPSGMFIALFPGGSIAERRWGGERFHAVAKDLVSQGHGIVVVGGKEDARTGRSIIADIPNALNLCGILSLRETAAVLVRSQLLITGDSGIMHLGYAVGTRVVALFGPGVEKKWAPRSDRVAVLNKRLECSPCTKFGYTKKCARDAECMKLITPAEVVRRSLDLLAGDAR